MPAVNIPHGVLAMAPPLSIGIRLLATREYAEAARPAQWLAFAAVAQGAYYVSALGINLSLRNHWLAVSTGGAAVAAAVANLVLVPRFGAEGAAAATFVAYVASASLTYVVAQRLHPLPYRGARLLALFGAGVLLGVGVVRLAPAGAWGWMWRGAALAAFAVLVWKSDVWRDRGAIRHQPAAS